MSYLTFFNFTHCMFSNFFIWGFLIWYLRYLNIGFGFLGVIFMFLKFLKMAFFWFFNFNLSIFSEFFHLRPPYMSFDYSSISWQSNKQTDRQVTHELRLSRVINKKYDLNEIVFLIFTVILSSNFGGQNDGFQDNF